MFGSIANNLELNLINSAFQYPMKDNYHYIGHLFGTDQATQTANYGLLSGPILLAPLIVSSIFAGMVSDKMNRTWLMCGSIIVWSAAILATAYAQNFIVVVVWSLIIGFTLGFFVPPAISLILDYFPVQQQTTAMAVFGIAEQLAAALVNTVTIFITALGWVNTYVSIGIFFIGVGVIGLIVIREPSRQKFTYVQKD